MADSGYILALDYGQKRTGVAIASTIACLPRPLTTLETNEHIFDAVAGLVLHEHVEQVVVGLPRGMDGGYTAQTRAAEAFGNELAAHLPVPLAFTDETLTSVDAEAGLRNKKHTKADVDALAAAHILERYFTETRGVSNL